MLIAQISGTHVKPELTRDDGRPTTRAALQSAVEAILVLPKRPRSCS